MTATDLPATAAHDDRARALSLGLPLGAAATVVTVALDFLRAHSTGESVTMAAIDVVVGGLLFALVVPRLVRREVPGWGGLVMAVLAALLLVPAFWSGLPLLLGVAGVLVGLAGRRASAGAGRATAALVLGAIAAIGYVAIYAADWIAHPAG